jgi:hypothetical protein
MIKVQKGRDEAELKCPVCRVSGFDPAATFSTLKSLFDIAKKSITYDCQGVNWGCTAKLSARDLKAHEAACEHAISICPGEGCNFKAPFRLFSKHGNPTHVVKKPNGPSRPCFIEIGDTKNTNSFFVWNIDIGGREMLDEENSCFATVSRGFLPAILRSQDPTIKACLLTSLTDDRNYFIASILWLEDDHQTNTRKKKKFAKLIACSCNCIALRFVGETAFQNWDKEQIQSANRQLRIHWSLFSDILNGCTRCKYTKNVKLRLMIELFFE